jgi:hypothetical protein
VAKTLLMGRLEKSRADRTMDLDGRADDLAGHVIHGSEVTSAEEDGDVFVLSVLSVVIRSETIDSTE